jgi:predicted PurR-regulated permease PerM
MGHRRFQGVGGEHDGQPGRERSSATEFATRAAIAITIACIGIISLWLAYRGMDVLLVIFGGVLIALLFRTMADPLRRYARLPLWAAVLVAVIVTLGVFTLAGWLIAPSVSKQIDELTVRLPEALDRFRAQFLSTRWAQWLMVQGGNAADGRKILQQITHAFQITFVAGGAIIIVMFLAIYMAAQPSTYVSGIVRLMPVGFRPRARAVLRELYRMLRVWMLTKLFTMVITGIGIGIGLWLMDIPMALSLAIFAGVLEFIPTVGPIVSAIPAILLAMVNGPAAAAQVAALYFAVQWVGNHVTTPLIQQKTLSIPPAVTLAMVALLGMFFGFGGLLLSGPLSVVIFVLVRMLYVEDVLERRRRYKRAGLASRVLGKHAPPLEPQPLPSPPL